jgi:hypothetical protein
MVACQWFALTCGHWTSIERTTFLAVTVTLHYINSDWQLVSLTLSCTEHRDRKTAMDCEREIKAAL